MDARTAVPFLDVLFGTVAGILAIMTQMQIVTSLPVEVARVGRGATVVENRKLSVVTLSEERISLDGKVTTKEQLLKQVSGKEVLLRTDRNLRHEEAVRLLADLVKAGAHVSLGVEERTPASPENEGR